MKPIICWKFLLYDLFVLIFRCIRKKILIFSLVIILSLVYYIILLMKNNHREKINLNLESTLEQHSISIVLDDNHGDDGFASLKRQHKLKEMREESSLMEEKSERKIGRLSLTMNNDMNSRSNSPKLFADKNDGLLLPPIDEIKCRNSVQGKLLIVDDRGQVCQRKLVSINGCCDEKHFHTRKYVCDTCQENKCCQIYEHCVSCCMAPKNRDRLNRMMVGEESKKLKSLKIFLSSISDSFELCLIKCRTSSASVLHENTYKNPNAKHCFDIDNDQ